VFSRKIQQNEKPVDKLNTKAGRKIWCPAKFLTCKISDFTPCAHAQSDIQHIKYAEKTDY